MSVLASKRKESKFEAITFSIDLHDMLLDFMQRSFGVKDLDHLVRVRYAYGKDETEDFAKYRYLMTNFKNRIDQLASQLTSNEIGLIKKWRQRDNKIKAYLQGNV